LRSACCIIARLFLILSLAAQFTCAQRKPVLPQIDLPHPYYFREMYLPQLTSGPSSVAWAPDSKSVVYSMGGSLWRQKISETSATQLTDGDGYDYQPDWSPDGKFIVFTSYQKDALELWLLDVDSGTVKQLTNGGAVNVEPRWSPDGKKLVFVSTAYNKRFHIFVADFRDGALANITRLTGETKSALSRYYYSAYDMEISPVWSRDGQEILFVSNRGHIYGTGGFWRTKAQPGAEAREIHYEETNWKARPDFSPDGSRMVYSSYLGGQWHQLWTMPAGGGDAFPLSYGDYDITNVRWSPDGKTLAYITNRSISTSLGLLEVGSGRQRLLPVVSRNFKREHGTIRVKVFDDNGAAVAARISVVDERGKFYAPNHARLAADDGYDRGERKFEAHYFDSDFDSSVTYRILEPSGRNVFVPAEHVLAIEAPLGMVTVSAMKGFEYGFETQQVQVLPGTTEVNLHLKRLNAELGDRANWISGDLHVHMNYGGIYKNSTDDLVKQAQSEGLTMVNALIVNKEQRFPDLAYRNGGTDSGTQKDATIIFGQEFHTSYWGHRGLLYPGAELLVPGYAGYPNTAASSLYPMNADIYDLVHSHGVLVGAVHPFDETPEPLVKPVQKITDELPIDVALGKLDYMEILGFSDHRSTAKVWYRLLNLGFRIPAGAGTDAMANFASLRGPVGMNRVFAHVDSWAKDPDFRRWLDALNSGRTFATNGPLLEFTLNGQQIGDELALPEPRESVSFSAKLRSIVPVDHLEVVCNGRVAATLKLDAARTSSDVTGTVPIRESGWCLLRASSDAAEYPVLDNYVYATTSPVYVSVGGKKPHSPEDAKYFVAWIDRVNEATAAYPDWNSADEKKYVLGRIAEAQRIYLEMEK
jgi:TolB protein